MKDPNGSEEMMVAESKVSPPRFTSTIGPNDVVLGRGVRNHQGNAQFMQLIAAHKTLYNATRRHSAKQEIAQTIWAELERRNMRFLSKVEEPHEKARLGCLENDDDNDEPVWLICDDQATIITKIKQALRELRNTYSFKEMVSPEQPDLLAEPKPASKTMVTNVSASSPTITTPEANQVVMNGQVGNPASAQHCSSSNLWMQQQQQQQQLFLQQALAAQSILQATAARAGSIPSPLVPPPLVPPASSAAAVPWANMMNHPPQWAMSHAPLAMPLINATMLAQPPPVCGWTTGMPSFVVIPMCGHTNRTLPPMTTMPNGQAFLSLPSATPVPLMGNNPPPALTMYSGVNGNGGSGSSGCAQPLLVAASPTGTLPPPGHHVAPR
jgi:hypothetical protein